MPKTKTTTKNKTTKATNSSKTAVPPPPAPVEEPVVEETVVEEPVVEESIAAVTSDEDTANEETSDSLAHQFDVLMGAIKSLGDNLRNVVKVMKTLRTQVNKLEKAEHKRDVKRKSKGERKNNTNSGFQKKHNIAGTPLAEFLHTDEASMVDAHKAICAYIKGRKGVAKFPGDERIIVMDSTLDEIFPGLIGNYPAAIELASKAVSEIEDKKERRTYLDDNIDSDTVLTYSGIMKRLPQYFKKDEPVEA